MSALLSAFWPVLFLAGLFVCGVYLVKHIIDRIVGVK
jgi:hypothetical protein